MFDNITLIMIIDHGNGSNFRDKEWPNYRSVTPVPNLKTIS